MNAAPAGKPYTDYRLFLQSRYGQRVYRIPVDLGLGCPHRGPDGGGGCLYCAEHGARAMHLRQWMPLRAQVEAGLSFARTRCGATGYLAYLQAFTATHAPAERLRELYAEVLALAPFCGLIVSTRPDCLPPDTVDLLAELVGRYDVWVELGVQTANDRTLCRLNRGHDFACSAAAVCGLAARGIHVAAHVILGLPGEGTADFRHTAAALCRLPLAGIKIHNLHVVEGAGLAAEWRRGGVPTLDELEYAEVLIDFLRRTPAAWPVMRLVADTPRARLLAPRWDWSKARFLAHVERQMHARGVRQGDLVRADG